MGGYGEQPYWRDEVAKKNEKYDREVVKPRKMALHLYACNLRALARGVRDAQGKFVNDAEGKTLQALTSCDVFEKVVNFAAASVKKLKSTQPASDMMDDLFAVLIGDGYRIGRAGNLLCGRPRRYRLQARVPRRQQPSSACDGWNCCRILLAWCGKQMGAPI